MNQPENFKPLGSIGLHTASDGTPCIAIQRDEGELFIQTRKGMGPLLLKTIRELPAAVSRLGLHDTPESFTGTAYNVRKSHESMKLVEESNPVFVALYLRSSVAELLAKNSDINLADDLE